MSELEIALRAAAKHLRNFTLNQNVQIIWAPMLEKAADALAVERGEGDQPG